MISIICRMDNMFIRHVFDKNLKKKMLGNTVAQSGFTLKNIKKRNFKGFLCTSQNDPCFNPINRPFKPILKVQKPFFWTLRTISCHFTCIFNILDAIKSHFKRVWKSSFLTFFGNIWDFWCSKVPFWSEVVYFQTY